jgi:hypothetical protein
MTLTNEQLTAFFAFGLLVMNEPEALLEKMSNSEIKEFAGEVDKYLSPFVSNEADVVSPVISILKEALNQVKGNK